MTLKVAIIGCGKIADGHVEQIRNLPGTARVVAVADLEPLIAEQLATRYGVPAFYADVDQLLERERPDVVHITTPPQSHLRLAQKALDAGAHVFVEKPMTLSYADSKRLVDEVVRSGRKLTIGYSYYLDPALEGLRALHRRGELGEVVQVETFLGYNLAGPFGKALLADGNHWVHHMPGKLFQNNIDHVLCELPYYLRPSHRDEPDDALERVRISAQGWIRRAQRFGDVRDHMLDELRVTFTTPHASAFAWFSSHVKPAGHFTRVYGTRATAEAHRDMGTVTTGSSARLPSAIGRLEPAFDQGLQFLREGARNVARFARSDFHYFSGLGRLLRAFYDSIIGGGPPPIPYRDMLRVAEWMDEIWRQVPQGGAAE